jgi:predicted MFS family arabinose efflux permease
VFFAPRFNRFDARRAAIAGFALGGVAFALSSLQTGFAPLAVLHFAGGLAIGTALSFTHGTMGHAANPHRVFAWGGLAIGVFGIAFLGAMPGLVQSLGGQALFHAFAAVMAAAAVVALLFFPRPTRRLAIDDAAAAARLPPLGRTVWLAILAVAAMAMTQSMTLAFFERVAAARGFSVEQIAMALVIYGLVTLLPAPLAALLQKRVSATTVVCTVPVGQAVFAMAIMHAPSHAMYAAAGAAMGFTVIFIHTFAFGLLARLDPSGRAVAGTPAMMMVGAALAPFVGGTLVKYVGFQAIGWGAVALVAIELLLFNQVRKALRGRPAIATPSPVAT